MKMKKILILLCVAAVTLGFVVYSMISWKGAIPTSSAMNSTSLNDKLKDALLGDGIIVLTEQEVNGLAGSLAEGNDRIKELFIDIEDDKMMVNSLIKAFGREFFVKSSVKPYMDEGSIRVDVEKVDVGKVTLPRWLVMYMAKKYLPENFRIVDGSTIEVAGGKLMKGIEDITLGSDAVRIALIQEIPNFATDKEDRDSSIDAQEPEIYEEDDEKAEAEPEKVPVQQSSKGDGDETPPKPEPKDEDVQKPAPAAEEPKSAPGPSPEEKERQQKVAALELTNDQLYGVLGDVKGSSARSWVRQVISVNSKMIDDPNKSFKGDVSSAKAAYESLSAAAREEIKDAALDNLDIAAVRYLVKAYDL